MKRQLVKSSGRKNNEGNENQNLTQELEPLWGKGMDPNPCMGTGDKVSGPRDTRLELKPQQEAGLKQCRIKNK